MADRKTIQIPVDVQLKIKDQSKAMRGISEEMQDIFANADPGTAFYKSLSKAIVAIEKKLNSADSLLGKEFFSEADLGKTTTLLGGVADILSEISTLAKRTSTIGLGFETDELIQANEALKALQATIRSTKKNTKVGAVSGMLDREEVKRMVASSKDTGFSAGKTFDENQAAIAKSLGKVTEEYVRFQQEAAAAAEIAEKAGKAVAASKAELSMAKGELQTRKDLNTNLAKQIADIKVSGQGATKENIAKQYQDVLLKQLTSVDGEKYAPIIAGWLDISEAELIGTATDIARNLEKAINTAMATGPAAKNKLRINAKSVIDGKAAAFQKDRIYGETEQKVAVATANVDTAEEAAKEAVSNLQAANNTVTQTSNLLATIQSQMAELKKLQAEYNALVDEQHANELNALKTKQQDADYKSREGERIFNKNVKNAQGEAKSGYDIYDQQQINRRLQEEQDRLEKEAARESQEFTNNLKQSIRHWMSAQQVINMVKDGIRQAYQDIKGLDTAMTNIAVVTDMSVSDLWGKINDYMSIAQQYGVTTQGVYEVSQLYYQQGLSTNEVMAATTETLKMARIAGMDYAEAADAMTVAIRAFKMEMTDAEHVTDVYSKVAAVTASDSEELAVAMSKTASSAESVGSSFENTTAMLAVMINVTIQ